MVALKLLIVVTCLVAGHLSFRISPTKRLLRKKLQLDGQLASVLAEPLESYANIWIPYFKDIQASVSPPFDTYLNYLVHWGHGAAMGTVLVVMGGIGSFLGYQIRKGNGSAQYAFTLGKTAREQHPLIMGLAFFFFLLGGQGGFVLTLLQGKPIMESAHADSAIIGLSLLAIQAGLPLLMKTENGKLARDVHAWLGTATMITLFVHGYNGVQLGLSF